jgi:hypothetical protein
MDTNTGILDYITIETNKEDNDKEDDNRKEEENITAENKEEGEYKKEENISIGDKKEENITAEDKKEENITAENKEDDKKEIRRTLRSTALISLKKRNIKSKKLPNKHIKMGRAYMIVKYDGENYSAYSIIESDDIENAATIAEEKAEKLTAEYNYKKHGYSAVPIHIPGTIPIIYLNIQTPNYYKNTPYYATMRSTYGGNAEYRAIALWKTEKEAILFADMSKSMKEPRFIYTYIGGPLEV